MKNVGLSAGDLSPSSLLIQGFNQEGQRALGMICLKLHIGHMVAETPFQVIDSRTSYNMLLGRPWLHANGVVPSTLHQCFKYGTLMQAASPKHPTQAASPKQPTQAVSPKQPVHNKQLAHNNQLAHGHKPARTTPAPAQRNLVKQSRRRFWPELVPEIEKEVNKLIAANFIREVKYLSWIANIVPVKKKNGQIRVCVNFRDLKKACPKDDFPLSITELMVDATTGHEDLSFMDGSSSYNQIRMDPKDEELTAFHTPKGIFCYKVMPFGLKNAGATYQRVMQNIFDDFLHKRVECYVDDLVVKTKQRSDHLLDLRAVFERLRRFQLKKNPLKCAFSVTSGKFSGFIVHHRGIEIDQSKIDAIQKMPEPRNISELKSFQGYLAYIRHFISNLAGRCQPFSHLMKKDMLFEWNESCWNVFNNIKAYLTKLLVLVAPIVDQPLLLYIVAQEK
ncbi:hypothetical protein H6P81_010511 [Aristolochia fimbriata]|uniref:Reverse transcriptase domain-containing protein n=1 Tax=Aristolochia fimbriata TaxID=158543 RepID=A0AAV7EQ45_ARIFI|nr:hypothetical protein H6P81_010511 [Aristolochia fimbriata]